MSLAVSNSFPPPAPLLQGRAGAPSRHAHRLPIRRGTDCGSAEQRQEQGERSTNTSSGGGAGGAAGQKGGGS